MRDSEKAKADALREAEVKSQGDYPSRSSTLERIEMLEGNVERIQAEIVTLNALHETKVEAVKPGRAETINNAVTIEPPKVSGLYAPSTSVDVCEEPCSTERREPQTEEPQT